MTRQAVVVGATGLVGRELVRILLNSKFYRRVIVISRKRLTIVHPRLEQQLISFSELSECPSDWFHQSDVFCTLGTTIKKAGTKEKFEEVDYQYVLQLGQLAKRYHSTKMLVITAMGANVASPFFYNQVKGKVEAALKELNLPQLYIFQPSLIMGERQENRWREELAIKLFRRLSFFFKGRLSAYKPIDAKDIAMAMMKVALSKQEQSRTIKSKEIKQISRIKTY